MLSSIAAVSGLEVAERQHRRPVGQRLEAVAQLVLVGHRDRRHRPPVEGVGEGQNAVFLRAAGGEVVAAAGLDRALQRLRPRIGEEHRVGEGPRHQPLGGALLVRRAVQVADMHQLGRLLLDRADQVRVAVPERVDRDAAGEIEPLACPSASYR